ncbi:MAG TPA: alpha/beta hydrolase family protein [Mycobacteriales bacterium]|nr:alpha/beta hydrolase family protein [Mycobacteriales bacterium]
MKHAVASGLVATGVALGWLVPAASSANAPGPRLRGGHGLHVVAQRRVDEREVNATMVTSALGKTPVDVRVALPVGYAAYPAKRYPTLYLYAGTGEHAGDWTTYGDIEKLTAHRQMIVVMPDVGFGAGDGWFSNWLNRDSSLGPNQWETFQIDQLIPWVDENFRTIADRSGRAVAGLSQGGFGAMIAATRHPDLFAAVASFSGAVDVAYGNPVQQVVWHSFVVGTSIADVVPPFSVFGDPVDHEVNWQGHDPTTLVTNLRGMDVHLYTGNGVPGPYDKPQSIPLASIEVLAHWQTHTMFDHAAALHVPMKLTDYGPGTHSWPYWIHDLRHWLPELTRVWASRPRVPAHVTYESTAPRWSQWGWTVDDRRTVPEQFTELYKAGRAEFVLQGEGTARVTTPPFYRGYSRVAADSMSHGHTRHLAFTPDRNGRITLTVKLPATVRLYPGDLDEMRPSRRAEGLTTSRSRRSRITWRAALS